jgi:hypothetical protein
MLDAAREDGLLKSLSREQKIGVSLLLIFAVLSVGLGFLQIRNTLYAPFALNNTIPTSLKDDINTPDALRFRDTDHDGLSDFDELYVYGTSPYLYDTFSYGMSDKEVVAKGLALCPKGQCNDTTEASAAGSTSSTLVTGIEPPTGLTPEDFTAALQDPAQIRAMLLAAGVNKTDLSKISDKDLLQSVAEVMNVSSTGAVYAQLNGGTTTTKP